MYSPALPFDRLQRSYQILPFRKLDTTKKFGVTLL